MTIAQFCVEHRDIVGRINRLIKMIDPENPPTMEQLAQARADLVAASDTHLLREAKFVERVLAYSPDPIPRGIAKRYQTQMVELQLTLAAHVGKWNPVTIRSDWAGYRAAVRERLAIAVKQIAWEERVVFPLVQIVQQSPSGTAERRTANAA